MNKAKNNVMYVLISLLVLSVALNISLSKNLKDIFSYESQCLMNICDYNSDLRDIINTSKDNNNKNEVIYNVKKEWDNLRVFLLNARNYSLNTRLLRKYLSKVDGTMNNISQNLNELLIKDINEFTNKDKEFINKFINLTSSIQTSGSKLRSKINFIIPIYTHIKVKGNLNEIVDTIIGSKL